ncbi:type III-D CRISPR-associated protein Csx19 [Nostoc sp.]|uniref:type III-D CRISPR-associated protein Csx19 n=1 Tax=Nostoc sp. TaxID=1180 RepID=UPI002FFCF0EA
MNKPLCQPLVVPVNLDLQEWLEQHAKSYKLKSLLAHAEDGVIWGKFILNGSLLTSEFSQCTKLRSCTLQQCRAFGENAEVMLWQTDEGLKARIIKDEHLKQDEYITEYQILLGTHGEKSEDKGFTLLWDGKQGLKHAVPFTDIVLEKHGKLKNPVRLKVNHYIDYNDAGVARIYLSRLVNLTAK